MNTTKRLGALLASGALLLAVAGTASAGVADYATVSGHEAFSSDANQEDYWGEDCTKLDGGEGNLGTDDESYVLGADYAKVIVKAGSDTYANTIFDNPTAGQTVWADTNGNNTFDPGGQDGDKNISHIIFCGETAEPTPTFEQSEEGETDAPTDAPTDEPSFDQSQEGETDAPSEPQTDALGTNGTSAPADGAWLLVVALGVLLASIVVLTPARAKGKR